MSIPREIRDQLLSGYLDDALSGDERARVEQLLATDPEFADDLEQFQDLGETLREVGRADSVVTLPGGFSNRVLDAAVAAAREEGLGDDHPLVRLTATPTAVSAFGSAPRSRWLAASGLVALAASIAVAVIVLRPPAGDDLALEVQPRGNPTGKVAVDSENSSTDSSPDVIGTDPQIAMVPEVPPSVAEVGDPDAAPAGNAVAAIEADTESNSAKVAAGPAPAGNAVAAVQANQAKALIEKAAAAHILIEIRPTAWGRQNQVVDAALKEYEVTQFQEVPVTDQLVAIVRKAGVEGSMDDARILYLEKPGAAFNRFQADGPKDFQFEFEFGVFGILNPIKNATPVEDSTKIGKESGQDIMQTYLLVIR